MPTFDVATDQSLFVIAQPGTSDLVTTVFEVGSDDGQEALAVFTSRTNAQTYIDDAGWSDRETVAELQPVDFARWLLQLPAGGPTFLTVNPVRNEQDAGRRQPVVKIADLIDELTATLLRGLETFSSVPDIESRQHSSYDIFTCQLCGHTRRQTTATQSPECCGTPMTLAARDARSETSTVASASMQ